MRSQPPGYLIDTFETQRLGMPAALCAIRESDRACAVRFDSGDQAAQLADLVAEGVQPTFVFMDGMNPEKIARLESVAEALGVPPRRRVYGCGGWLVSDPAPTLLTRNNVSAVYKLCQSGTHPVMKFSVQGKQSLPGRPVIFRRSASQGPIGLIGQEGETPPKGYHDLTNIRGLAPPGEPRDAVGLSPATAGLVSRLSSILDAKRAV
jgi:nicotinic acid phosphoribosyltransferase